MFQFRRFPPHTYGFSVQYRSMSFGEFPHSEIPGSMDICSSPRLIAAYHVFRRLPVPRHSPCALCSLTVVSLSQNISLFQILHLPTRFYHFTVELSFSNNPLGEIIDFNLKNQEFYIANKISFRSSIFSFQGTSHKGYCGLPSQATLWWAEMDSNHRPLGYQPSALTS